MQIIKRNRKEIRLKTDFSISLLQKRVFAVGLAFLLLFSVLFSRFFYVQVLWQEELNYRALDQWTRELPIIAKRGKITDRNGVVLADNKTAYTVFARANAIENKENAAKMLAQIFSVSETEIYQKLTKRLRISKACFQQFCLVDLFVCLSF